MKWMLRYNGHSPWLWYIRSRMKEQYGAGKYEMLVGAAAGRQ
jgi:hypothetical protein